MKKHSQIGNHSQNVVIDGGYLDLPRILSKHLIYKGKTWWVVTDSNRRPSH